MTFLISHGHPRAREGHPVEGQAALGGPTPSRISLANPHSPDSYGRGRCSGQAAGPRSPERKEVFRRASGLKPSLRCPKGRTSGPRCRKSPASTLGTRSDGSPRSTSGFPTPRNFPAWSRGAQLRRTPVAARPPGLHPEGAPVLPPGTFRGTARGAVLLVSTIEAGLRRKTRLTASVFSNGEPDCIRLGAVENYGQRPIFMNFASGWTSGDGA
jgi:hypothetical protein